MNYMKKKIWWLYEGGLNVQYILEVRICFRWLAPDKKSIYNGKNIESLWIVNKNKRKVSLWIKQIESSSPD